MHLIIILQLQCIMFLFPLSYFYQHSSDVYKTCNNGNANMQWCYVLGGRESILLTVIGKNLFFGYPNKLIPMWDFPSSERERNYEVHFFKITTLTHNSHKLDNTLFKLLLLLPTTHHPPPPPPPPPSSPSPPNMRTSFMHLQERDLSADWRQCLHDVSPEIIGGGWADRPCRLSTMI